MSAIPFTTLITIVGAVLWLVALEGLLSADNALVLAVMVRHLPKHQQKRALRLGIWGAFFFRAVAVIFASLLLRFWWLKVVGGVYLLYLAIRHFALGEHDPAKARDSRFSRGFWGTVVSVEIADLAFSIDSILAAVAMAEGLPKRVEDMTLGTIPGIGAVPLKLAIVYVGGVLGIIAMRLVAGVFLVLLEKFKGLAAGAYVLVGWIGLKLLGSGLHAWRAALPFEMPDWLFWVGMLLIVTASMAHKPGDGGGGHGVEPRDTESPASPNGAPNVPEADVSRTG
jgi:YkoY family integral membrane protein